MDAATYQSWQECFKLYRIKNLPSDIRYPEHEARLLSEAAKLDSPPLPPDWERRVNRGNPPRIYYVHVPSKCATWVHPVSHARFEKPLNVPPPNNLPDNWTQRKLKDGRIFYTNKITKEGSFMHPESLSLLSMFSDGLSPPWVLRWQPTIPGTRTHVGAFQIFNTKTKTVSQRDPRPYHAQFQNTYENTTRARNSIVGTRGTDYLFSSGSHPKIDILMTSYLALMKVPPQALSSMRIAMDVPHDGDFNSPEQTWIDAIFKELFNPERKIFKPFYGGVLLNLDFKHEDGYNLLRFAGRVHGIAIRHQLEFDISFSLTMFNILAISLSPHSPWPGTPGFALRGQQGLAAQPTGSTPAAGTTTAPTKSPCQAQDSASAATTREAHQQLSKWNNMANHFLVGLSEVIQSDILIPFVTSGDFFGFQLALMSRMHCPSMFKAISVSGPLVRQQQDYVERLKAGGALFGLVPQRKAVKPPPTPTFKEEEEEEEEWVSVEDLVNIGLYKR